VELGGGLLLVSGFWTRTAATALALFCLVTALTFHSNFANQSQMIHFLKNVMMTGGLLQMVAFGVVALSIDNPRAKGGEVWADKSQTGENSVPGPCGVTGRDNGRAPLSA
jgi:putative oxidoreductase